MNSRFEGSYMGDASKLDDDARLECGICWWVYDPVVGDDVAQVAPGTPFARLPDTWRCPNCDAEKPKFMVIGSVMGETRELDAVTRLVNYYRHASINMKGLPIYNPTLAVEAVGFRAHDSRQVGVIVTPWFMNLTVLPGDADRASWKAGGTARLAFPSGLYDFVVSEAGDNGMIATCSLFSPMQDFTDHEAAQVAALAAADALFEADPPAAPAEPKPAPTISRRSLFGG
jgi:[NiFe] hydrogenase assembly HybE family chaperone